MCFYAIPWLLLNNLRRTHTHTHACKRTHYTTSCCYIITCANLLHSLSSPTFTTVPVVEWDAATNTVIALMKKPVDMTRMYLVCINYGMLEGLDNVVPLLEYKSSQPLTDANIHKPPEAAIFAKEAIVSYYSKVVLFNMIKEVGGFSSLDADGDGFLSRDELIKGLSIASAGGSGSGGSIPSEMLVTNLFNVADADGSGTISKAELLALSMSMNKIVFPSNRPDDMLSIDEVAREVPPSSPPSPPLPSFSLTLLSLTVTLTHKLSLTHTYININSSCIRTFIHTYKNIDATGWFYSRTINCFGSRWQWLYYTTRVRILSFHAINEEIEQYFDMMVCW